MASLERFVSGLARRSGAFMYAIPLVLAAAGEAVPSITMVLPFAILLLLIAVAPLFFRHFWERYYWLIASGLGAVSALYYLLILQTASPMLHAVQEYAGFMALVGSLYVITGGIHIRVKGEATPGINCLFLFCGAILANLFGTTGASMLLIRPWIRMNKYRVTAFHIVFFIFVVSNAGGCLTPIGDPPLFLGYLRGVPFWWTLENCFVPWLIAVLALIGIFFVLDRRNFHRAPKQVRDAQTAQETWKVDGAINLVFLGVVLGAVFLPAGIREIAMIVAAAGSYFTTPDPIHEANDFNFHPVKEVAWLFAGIFATMVPALHLLELNAPTLAIRSEMQFYWFTGALSGVLDNAPTYLAFLAAAMGLFGLSADQPQDVTAFVAQHEHLLVAISLGAVFFGAMTYIGNGPNFMVKAIADQQKVETPSFLGYVGRYSIPTLLPVFAVIAVLFFSRWRVF